MTDIHTPQNRPKLCLNQHSLNVNSINVRCFSPINGEFRSPNLSPITNMLGNKSPVSPMHFKKPLEKQQQRQPPKQQKQQAAAPPKIKVSAQEKKKKHEKKKEENNNSLDCFTDDSNNSGVETPSCRESRRRSIQATNHNYVVNHASNVREVLLLVGLERYLDKFEKSRIDMLELVSMKRADLKKIGLCKDEDCDRVLDALKEL